MQLSPRQMVVQFAHLLQADLFPRIAISVGALSEELELLGAVMALSPLERMVSARRSSTGRPARDRAALATAFMAKAILNLPTTRDLISRLRVDEALRRFCGWSSERAVPHESKFSRAFAEFAVSELPQQLHEAMIAATQQQRLIGHIARDSTAILAREHFPETAKQKAEAKRAKQAKKKGRKPGMPKGHIFVKKKGAEQGKRIARQRGQKLDRMLKDLPRQCDIGTKTSSKGHQQYWRGYKLHLDVADGQLPISAVLTSASVHDSQVAIPLMTMTSQRVVHLYELMDSAYDAGDIHAHCKQLKHVPIIAPHARPGTINPLKNLKRQKRAFSGKSKPELTWAQQERYKIRTMSERVNARLKDEFGASQIRVRGAVKVMAHLMFGVLALTVDQWLRMSASG